MSTGWGKRRSFRPDPGVEVAADDTLFDVVEWRKGQTVSRGDQTQVRTYDSTSSELLKEVLLELKEIAFHLQVITGEKI